MHMNLSILYPHILVETAVFTRFKENTNFLARCVLFLSQFSICSNLSLCWVYTVYTSRLKQTVTRVYSSRGWYSNSTLKMWDFAPINCPFLPFLSLIASCSTQTSEVWPCICCCPALRNNCDEQLQRCETTLSAKVLQLAMIQLAWICWRHFGGGAGWGVSTGWGGVQHVEGCIEVQVGLFVFNMSQAPGATQVELEFLMSFFLIRGKDGERHQMMDHACRTNTFLHSQFCHEILYGRRSKWNVQWNELHLCCHYYY